MYLAVGTHLPLDGQAELFATVRALGAEGVELRVGQQEVESQPQLQPGAPAALRSQARAAGLVLPSVYAGYVAGHPLSHPDPDTCRQHAEVVARVVAAAAEAGARVVVLPLFAAAEPHEDEAVAALAGTLRPLAEQASAAGLALGLETALPVAAVLALLRRLDCPAVGVAYDLGTAVALGYDPVADLKLLGSAVVQLRLRDCSADGRRVPLGQGVVGARWKMIRDSWTADERWGVLEVPAADDAPRWVQEGMAFLRPG